MTISYKHAPRAGADEKFPNADITLSDGVTTLGLRLCNAHGEHDPLAIKPQPIPTTTLRTGSGVPGYSDQEPPFTSYLQDDWSGGLGNKEFDADSTRFLEGFNIDTVKPGRVILGPKRQVQSGLPASDTITTGTPKETTQSVLSEVPVSQYASPITPASGFTVKNVQVKIYTQGASTLFVNLYDDDSDKPGDVIATNSLSVGSGTQVVDVSISATLSGATKYWLAFHLPAGSKFYTNDASGSVMKSWMTLEPPASGWNTIDADHIIAFTLSGVVQGEVRFFEYKGSLYAVTKPERSEAPRVFRNGISGTAKSNASNLSETIVQDGVTLVTDLHIGNIIKITGGAGSTEEVPWRVIVDNTTSAFVVSPNWTIAQDGTTTYAVLGQDYWYEITGHGLTKPVTDVLEVDGIVYFAQGEDTNMRRFRAYANAGTWTHEWAADGTNKAYHLALLVNGNGRYVYKTLPSLAQIDKSEVKAWGTDLAFSGAIKCGSNNYRVTNIIPYGEYGELYVVKENELGKIGDDDKYIPMPISELRSVASQRNGTALLHHGVYLYLSLLNGYLERYYEGRLDDMGPNQGEGLADGKEGVIADLAGYPGRFYAAVNAGKNGYSSVLCYNGTGWHPIYVSSEAGKRINQLYIQSIAGDPEQNRLWVAEETNLFALSLALDPLKDETYQFASYGYLISAWFYGGMKGLQKFWNSLSVFAENLTSEHVYTKVSYRTDTDSTWYEIGTFDTEPYEEIDCSEDDDATGRRFQYRLELFSDDASKTPQVEAVLIDAVERVPPKDGYQIRFLVEDTERDLEGKITGLSAKDIRDQLNTWRDSRLTPSPLTMRVNHPLFDNVKVFIDPAPLQPFQLITTPNIKAGGYKLIGSLSMIEV